MSFKAVVLQICFSDESGDTLIAVINRGHRVMIGQMAVQECGQVLEFGQIEDPDTKVTHHLT